MYVFIKSPDQIESMSRAGGLLDVLTHCQIYRQQRTFRRNGAGYFGGSAFVLGGFEGTIFACYYGFRGMPLCNEFFAWVLCSVVNPFPFPGYIHAKGLYHAQGYITPRRAISRPSYPHGLYHVHGYITSRAISRPCIFPRAISRPGLYHAHRGLYHIRG